MFSTSSQNNLSRVPKLSLRPGGRRRLRSRPWAPTGSSLRPEACWAMLRGFPTELFFLLTRGLFCFWFFLWMFPSRKLTQPSPECTRCLMNVVFVASNCIPVLSCFFLFMGVGSLVLSILTYVPVIVNFCFGYWFYTDSSSVCGWMLTSCLMYIW